MTDIIIKIENLCKSYEKMTPLNNLNCEIKRNEIISVIGGSGCGKSTFIRMINLLDKPTSGKIFIDGNEITCGKIALNLLRQKVGMVFQSYNLFPHMTVIENILYSPLFHKILNKKDAFNYGKKLLEKVGLENKMYSYPFELSGGQKQRVAIARTLAMKPEVILFDEPTSALDPTTTFEIKRVIGNLKKDGLTAIVVTHDMELAKSISDRVFYLDEGIVYESGTPDEIFISPKKLKTKDFIRKQKSFLIDISSFDFDFLACASKLDEFLTKHNVDLLLKQNIELAFEEICVVNLLNNHTYISETNNNVLLQFSLEYSLESKITFCIIKYNYPNYNIINSSLELSRSILDKIVNNVSYKHLELDDLPNVLQFEIKGTI